MRPILAKEWLPDLAFYNTQALIDAKNVVPGGAAGFKPLRGLVAVTDAMNKRVRGARVIRRNNNTLTTIAGTETKLYKLSSSLTWTDISDAAYNTAIADGIWSICQFGTIAIMTNLGDNVKKYDTATAPATVSDLLGTPPRARFAAVVKNQVFLAHLSTDEAGYHFSGFNNCEQWTAGVNLSDTGTLPEGGRIMGMIGGEVGYMFQERMTRAAVEAPGSPDIFQIRVVSEDRGLAAWQGIAQVGNAAWMLAHDGFFLFNRGQYQPIGNLKVDEWFYENAHPAYVTRTVCGVDPKKKLVFWAFISNEISSAASIDESICDKVLIYHWVLDQWAWAEVDISCFIDIANQGTGLDSLDPFGTMETLPVTLDSPIWNADNISSVVGVFDESFKLAYFQGDYLEANLQWKNIHFFAPKRQLFRSAWPICDAADIQAAISGRELLSASESFGSYKSIEADGRIPLDHSARTHDIKFKIPAASSWSHFRGFVPDAIEDGE